MDQRSEIAMGHFAWGRGYGAFSVSHSDVERVANYIARQGEHHKKRTWAQEYQLFVERYGLEWRRGKPLKRFQLFRRTSRRAKARCE